MAAWEFPLDPYCPQVARFKAGLWDAQQASVPRDVLQEIWAGFCKGHRADCKRCQEYGAANVDVG